MSNGQLLLPCCTYSDYRNLDTRRGWVHKDFRQGMPGWVCLITCSPNLSMELPQLLTHCRNWRMHLNLSGTSCYPPFVSIGTSRRSMECSCSGFKVWPFRIPTYMRSARKSICYSHTGIQGAHWDGCFIKHIRCFRSRSDLAGIFFPDPLTSLADMPPIGSFVISGNSSIDMELCFIFTLTSISCFSGNRTAH
jgi:hypothetical protein